MRQRGENRRGPAPLPPSREPHAGGHHSARAAARLDPEDVHEALRFAAQAGRMERVSALSSAPPTRASRPPHRSANSTSLAETPAVLNSPV